MIPIQEYIEKFKSFPLLKAKEERAMLLIIRTPPPGTPEDATDWVLTPEQKATRDEFICRNIRLVIHTAKKFCKLEDPRIMDFISAGVQGMLHGLNIFDIDRGVRFSTYANWWIQARIRDEIKVSDDKIVRFKTINQHYKTLRNNYIRDGIFKDDEELFAELGWGVTKIEKFQADQQRLKISLSAIQGTGGEMGYTDSSLLVEPAQDEVLEEMHKQEEQALLRDALSMLSLEQRIVVESHVGLNREEKTYDQLAEELGITRERIRKIESKALRMLWRHMTDKAPSLRE